MSWFDDLVNDVEDALGTLGDIINAILAGANVAGIVINPGVGGLLYVVNGVAYGLFDLIGIHMRSLTPAEIAVVRGVFQNTVPVDRILVTSLPGKDGRAYTLPGSMVVTLGPLILGNNKMLALSGLLLHLQDKFLINVGDMYSDQSLLPSAYDTTEHEMAGSLLVHETTHVWQGVNSAFSWWYIFDSLYNQLASGDHAYDVDETHLQTWESYGVEQQAVLVEHWYSRGSSLADSNYPFIRDNIRAARPWAKTLFTVLTTVFQAGATGSATAGGRRRRGRRSPPAGPRPIPLSAPAPPASCRCRYRVVRAPNEVGSNQTFSGVGCALRPN